MKQFLYLIAGVAIGWIAKSILSGNADYISLENIRRGIKNSWYTAKLANKDGNFYVRLTGKETDGDVSDGYYPITEQTFQTLLQEDRIELES